MNTFIAGVQFAAGMAWGILGFVGLVFVVVLAITKYEQRGAEEGK